MRTPLVPAALLLALLTLPVACLAEDAANAEAPGDAAGHSFHGQVFDDGPRQAAYLMPGAGKVSFPVTTKSPEAQQFVNQGVAQLHGFWYFEAERSFRQAAMLDPDCAMAYWGMCRANIDNAKRAKKFLAEALERKKGLTERETMYLDALEGFLKDEGKKKDKSEAYAKALERILYKHPDDLEAKAFLGLQLWLNRNDGSPITSHLAVDALLQQVLAADPLHPCHHYVIHLWDYEKAEKALVSASKCGESAPAIAHMWHMPGHIYSRLNRYHDAVWQQEASARVDHAHMMRDRILPDQIHNFAHNNEWLIRNLTFIGRAHDAIDLAKNMIELPRHPKYNTLSKRGSTYFGRLRLFETLSKFEQWDELIALADKPYLEPTDDFSEQVKRLRALGEAQFRKGDAAAGEASLRMLEELLAPHKKAEKEAIAKAEEKANNEIRQAREAKVRADHEALLKKSELKPGEVPLAETLAEAEARSKTAAEVAAKAKKDDDAKLAKARDEARKPTRDKVDPLEKAIDEVRGHQAVAKGDYKTGIDLLKKGGGFEQTYLARLQLLAGQKEEAEKTARGAINSHKNETLPLAALVEVLWGVGKKDEAKKTFEELRGISSAIDSDVAPFARLTPIAKELGYPEDWRLPRETPADFGPRPDLASLGPFRWQPSPAPSSWSLVDADGKPRSLADYRGRPVVVIFYLGHGCLHCVEQIHKFGKADEFSAAGLSLVAISSESQADLTKSVGNFGATFPFPLVANSEMDVFRAWRVYDDFEKQPLHGTFLLDGEGRVRWQDVSYEPFNDADFVLTEAKRLLGQSAVAPLQRPEAAAVQAAPTGGARTQAE